MWTSHNLLIQRASVQIKSNHREDKELHSLLQHLHKYLLLHGCNTIMLKAMCRRPKRKTPNSLHRDHWKASKREKCLDMAGKKTPNSKFAKNIAQLTGFYSRETHSGLVQLKRLVLNLENDWLAECWILPVDFFFNNKKLTVKILCTAQSTYVMGQ